MKKILIVGGDSIKSEESLKALEEMERGITIVSAEKKENEYFKKESLKLKSLDDILKPVVIYEKPKSKYHK